MKKLILMIVPALICGMMFTNCSGNKNEKPEVQQKEQQKQQDVNTKGFEVNGGKDFTFNIEGKWKLEVFSYWEGKPINLEYSQNDIIYDFNNNDALTVSGKTDNIVDYRGHAKGEHSYKVHPVTAAGYPIEIDTETYTISFGWVFFDTYEGSAMHMSTQNGTLILVKVD